MPQPTPAPAVDLPDSPPPSPRRIAPWAPFVLALGVLLAALVVIPRLGPPSALLDDLAGWTKHLGPWGPLGFGLVYVMAVVCLVPGSALTLVAGGVFGPVVGFVTVTVAANLGAALAFLIARHLARGFVARRLQDDARLRALDRAVAREGWKIVALLRLSPLVPFNVQNYLYGITGIGAVACFVTTLLAMVPGTLLYVMLGVLGRATLEAAVRSTPPALAAAQWSLTAVGVAATLAVSLFLGRLARRALAEIDTSDNISQPPQDSPT